MKTILVIEDVRSLREEIIAILDCLDYTAIAAADGKQGIELARLHFPDLVLCDIMMPEMDGYEVFQTLNQDPETAHIPFIFLSAKADKTDVRRGMNLGADDYLTKPFTSEELSEAIAARLAKQEAITQPYIDEMKRATYSLQQLAFRDPLTNLPNRILLRHELNECLQQARQRQTLLAVICLHINHFNAVNSNLGHVAGDQLLQMIATRLQDCLGPSDVVARLSGVEFCLLLAGRSQPEEVEQWIHTLLEILAEPYTVASQEVRMQFGVGITLYPQDSHNGDVLLNHADLAMRSAKKRGQTHYQFYNPEQDAESNERQRLIMDVDMAIDRGQFHLYYQPLVNLITRRIIGAEALLRWQHPELGMISPETFIPLAEETGAIVKIGQWVLKTACLQAQTWQSSSLLPLRVSVNVSARQLQQTDFTVTVKQVLTETNTTPELLTLEVTETGIIDNLEASIEILTALRSQDIQIALDDFGTGYSSLNYLSRLPLDAVKIDRAFVGRIQEGSRDATIVTSIIAISQTLKLKVIAEGVETEDQVQFLQKHGCNAIQGYWYSPPLPAADFERFLCKSIQQADLKFS
ncbi:EAL domain-containing response regulator [Trichothermofontia sp.]